MDDAPDESAPRPWRPALPTSIVVIAVVVSLVSVSALLLVLFRRTVGPGEVLRDFSRLLQEEDCGGTYGLLAPEVAEQVPEEAWCESLPEVAGHLNPDFSIEGVRLRMEVARLRVAGEKTTSATWLLQRADRSWTVLGVDGPVPFPADVHPPEPP